MNRTPEHIKFNGMVRTITDQRFQAEHTFIQLELAAFTKQEKWFFSNKVLLKGHQSAVPFYLRIIINKYSFNVMIGGCNVHYY